METGGKATQETIDVLCVDDDPDMLDLSEQFLEREDERFRVHTAHSAREALDRLADGMDGDVEDPLTVDAVVSDYRMPRTDGLEFLETLRQDRNDDTPFIMFTGQGREEVAMDALNLGADRYLQKRGDPTAQYGVLTQAIVQEVDHARAEQARRESEKRYQSLFENNPLVIWEEDFSSVKAEVDALQSEVEDLDAYFEANPDEIERLIDKIEIRDVNRNALSYYHADSKAELLDSFDRLFTEESHEATKEMLVKFANDEQQFRTESAAETLDGQRREELLAVYVPDEYADDYSRVYVTGTDITDRKHAERALDTLHEVASDLETTETPEDVYDALVSAAVDTLHVDHVVVFEHADAATGADDVAVTDGEVGGGPLRVVRTGGPAATPSEPDPHGDTLARETYERGETILVGDTREADRVSVPTDVLSVASAPLGDHGVIQVGVRDADELGERDLNLVAHLASHGGGTLSRIERERRLRRSDELLQTLSRTFPDYAFVLDGDGRYREVLLGAESEEGRLNDPGELLDERLEDVVSAESADAIKAGIHEALATGEVQVVEYEIDYPDSAIRYEGQIAPMPDADGRVILSARNITNRHETEQRLRKSNARLAELSSALSHDLRNLLSVLDGDLTLIAEECDHERLADARKTVERMDSLLDEASTLAAREDVEPDRKPVELSTVATETWGPFSSTGAMLEVDCEGVVSADDLRLRRLFENLFANAVEHSSTNIETDASRDAVDRRGDDVTVTVGRLPDGFFVADDGLGIPEADRETVFEYGYSTDPDGTGFGLSIVENVANAHGWTVTATESADGGARFEVSGVDVRER